MAMGILGDFMWKYVKKLEYPICIDKRDLKLAKAILTQCGGPGGELAASLQYLAQRYNMPDDLGKSLLTDIGTEELGHVEMIQTMVYQLMKGASVEEIKEAGLEGFYGQNGISIQLTDANGVPFTSAYVSSTGDYMADLENDLGAEQKARATYEHLMDLTDDPNVLGPLSFLRQREIVHYQRFKELKEHYLKMKRD